MYEIDRTSFNNELRFIGLILVWVCDYICDVVYGFREKVDVNEVGTFGFELLSDGARKNANISSGWQGSLL